MRIQHVEIGRSQIPLRAPFVTALRTVTTTDDVTVRIITDTGLQGLGGTAPASAVTGETHASATEALEKYIVPAIRGREISDLNGALRRVERALPSNTVAKAAADLALHDLYCQAHGISLVQFLGGGASEIKTDLTISLDTPEKMAEDARLAVARGFTELKVKLGAGGVASDRRRIEAVARATDGRALLRLDANQAWQAKSTVRLVGELLNVGIPIDCLEQPVPRDDLEGLKRVTHELAIDVLADESAFSAAEAYSLLRADAIDGFVVKLAKAGGLQGARTLIGLARAAGRTCMMSCMLEGPTGIAAAAALAASAPDVVTRVDLDAPLWLDTTPTGGMSWGQGPILSLNRAP